MTTTSHKNWQSIAALAFAALGVSTIGCGQGMLTSVEDGGVIEGTGGAGTGGITGTGGSISAKDANGADTQTVDAAKIPRWQKLPETPLLGAVELKRPYAVFMGDRITFLTWGDSTEDAHNETWSYRFAQNDWVRVSQGPMSSGGAYAYAGLAWTGARLFYWSKGYGLPLGGMYDPLTDTWSPISLDNAPSSVNASTAYTGQEVFLRGDQVLSQAVAPVQLPLNGVFYNPSTDRWREAPTTGIPTAGSGAVVGIGDKIVVWGGVQWDPTGSQNTLVASGAVYDAVANRWTPIAPLNAPGPRAEMIAFSTRGQAFVWGGSDWKRDSLGNLTAFRDGAMYDPTRDLWTPIATVNSPVGAVGGFWAEEQGLVYLWAGQDSPGATLWTYNPATNTWATFDISALPALQQVSFHWTGSKLLAIGFVGSDTAGDAAASSLRLTGYLLTADTQTPEHPVDAGKTDTTGSSTDTGAPVDANPPDVGPASDTIPPRFTQVAVSNTYSCGLKSDGTFVCWGCSASSLAGTLTQISTSLWYHACGLKTDGAVRCWGRDISCGNPEATPPVGTFRQVSAGSCHGCGVKTDGAAVCWGDNADGQATPPTDLFTQISAGMKHACGVRLDGTVACWGRNAKGESTPSSGTFAQLSAGGEHTCGLKTDGSVACWGSDSAGQSSPPAGAFTQLSAGLSHTCGLRTDGTVACWGDNASRESAAPTGTFTQVSAGVYHSCGVRTDGTIACWGCAGFDGCGMCTAP